MSNEKVTVTKEVAEAILQLRRECVGNYRIINRVQCAAETGPALTLKAWAFYSSGKGTPDKLMQALVNGYEVEITSEERLLQYFHDLRKYEEGLEINNLSGAQYRQGWMSVRQTINILGITVEGINDRESPL